MKKKVILPIVLMVIFIGFLSGCMGLTLHPPNVTIISRDVRMGAPDFNYTYYIDVTLYNYGGNGSVTVWAKLIQGDNFWIKNEKVYINRGKTEKLTFKFEEIRFWTLDEGTYQVWVD